MLLGKVVKQAAFVVAPLPQHLVQLVAGAFPGVPLQGVPTCITQVLLGGVPNKAEGVGLQSQYYFYRLKGAAWLCLPCQHYNGCNTHIHTRGECSKQIENYSLVLERESQGLTCRSGW